MSEYATKIDVQEIVEKAVSDLSAVLSQFANDVNDRFDKVDARFGQIDERLNKLEELRFRGRIFEKNKTCFNKLIC